MNISYRQQISRISLLAVLAVAGIVLPVQQAEAVVPPPCETTECPGTGPEAWAAVTSAGLYALADLEASIYANMVRVKDALTRLANQSTNNRQNLSNSFSGINDSNNATMVGQNLGSVRAQILPQILPSRTACGQETVKTQIFMASAASRAAIGGAETATTAILTNAPSTPGNLGQLGYSSARFQNRMTKYCNTATVNPPGTISCTATIGVDKDLFPYDSIFKPPSLASANAYTAAKDVVLNLMGDAVLDPVRGQSLLRQEGQNLSIQRYSEQAKINLSADILQSIIETRRDLSGGGSEQSQRDSSYNGMALRKLAEINAGQTKGQNLDTLAPLLSDVNRDMLTLQMYLENMAALVAVGLSVNITNHSAGSTSIAGRPVSN